MQHLMKSGAMIPLNPRSTAPRSASFHDATARETYASWFRPIAIPAVAAGTRQVSRTLERKSEDRRVDIPGVLRDDFDD
ncbi:hypothetical protein SAMN04488115_107336 [Bosea lathyri]|jgi:hypothetical protein|uniref:Uncharacterized protein n=1 Tax=Bosea lathyri TaxID=1036778 RepID=A0A1H6BL58_9HYPH|nr:hypothetical protein SAMN04488115_107336 [Bosea lathyri]